MAITWAQALAWRMRRQLLEPIGDLPVEDVVRGLGAVPSMDEGLAELAVRTRRTTSKAGELSQALADGRVIKAFAFRGAMHYLSPEDGGAYLAIRCAGRQWELPSWVEFYELAPDDWPAFRATVREVLTDGPLTIAELGAGVTAHRRYRNLKGVFGEGAGTLIKPLTWQGDMGFGPPRDGRHTFQRLDTNSRWKGVWELHEAGPYAVEQYFRSYGPATYDHIHHYYGGNLSAGRKRLNGWLAELEERLAEVDVEGETHYVMRDDLDELMATKPSKAVRFLPGHDQWVMAPGTKDVSVTPTSRRDPVTRKANVLIAGGVVCGTWTVKGDALNVTWFEDAGRVPRTAITEEAVRIGEILGIGRPPDVGSWPHVERTTPFS
jgi:Winged helix DNA-binding domain